MQQSTRAIQQGRYKEVNIVGAASITAVLNLSPALELPFVFGGDGAAILIPPSLVEPAKATLLATRDLARSEFGLALRVGVVPVADVVRNGYPLRVAKIKMSEAYAQAMFSGGGLAHAEHLVKAQAPNRYLIDETTLPSTANYAGLECRWQDVMSPHGETVTLLVVATDHKKYDDMLRMIIAGTPAQREELTSYLDEQQQAGQLRYGMQISNRALMTCLVFERMGRQFHFIDGADGGYALAAQQLKQRLKQTRPSRPAAA